MNNKKNNDHRLINIYSKALFSCSLESNTLEIVASDLSILQELHDNIIEIQKICSLSLFKDKQDKLPQIILPLLNLHKIVGSFVTALASNSRLSLLIEIIAEFNKKLTSYRQEENFEIISTSPLSQEEITILRNKLLQELPKKINIITRDDKDLLGGIIIKQGNKILDLSIKNKLEKMRELTKEKIRSI